MQGNKPSKIQNQYKVKQKYLNTYILIHKHTDNKIYIYYYSLSYTHIHTIYESNKNNINHIQTLTSKQSDTDIPKTK